MRQKERRKIFSSNRGTVQRWYSKKGRRRSKRRQRDRKTEGVCRGYCTVYTAYSISAGGGLKYTENILYSTAYLLYSVHIRGQDTGVT